MNIEQRFALEARLNQGLSGAVYQAVDTSRSGDGAAHRVALVMLPRRSTSAPGAAAGLEQNFSRLRDLSHPNIAGVFELLRYGERFVLTSELVDGENLRTVLEGLAPERLEEEEAALVLRGIGSALEYAHNRGIVHGAVRAENVVITPAREVKLMGFVFGVLLDSGPLAVTEEDDVRDFAKLAYELYTGTLPPPEWGDRPPAGLSRRRWMVLKNVLSVGEPTAKQRHGMTLRELLRDADLLTPEPLSLKPAGPSVLEAAPPGRRHWRARLPFALLAAGALLLGAHANLDLSSWDVDEGLRWTRTAAHAMNGLLAEAQQRARARETRLPVDRQEATLSGVPERPIRRAAPSDISERPAPAAGPDRGAPGNEVAPADPPKVQFVPTEIRAYEYETLVAIDVMRTGDTTLPVEFVWWTSDGTATAEDDYANFGRRVEAFDLGHAAHTIHVPLVSDSVPERSEYFYVHIDPKLRGAALGARSTMSITIIDDD